jgi:hypothetical protein
LKAPVGAVLIALRIAQDKDHDIAASITAASVAVVTTSSGI